MKHTRTGALVAVVLSILAAPLAATGFSPKALRCRHCRGRVREDPDSPALALRRVHLDFRAGGGCALDRWPRRALARARIRD
jgi:hypothetical protein